MIFLSLTTAIFALCTIFLALYSTNTSEKLVNARRQLKQLKTASAPKTPIKELAADFRSFVEGVEGKVSPEVDAALKKLEKEEKIKLVNTSSPKSVVSKRPSCRGRMDAKMWGAFVGNFTRLNNAYDKWTYVKDVGMLAHYTREQQKAITSALHDSIKLYGDINIDEYFKMHNEVSNV